MTIRETPTGRPLYDHEVSTEATVEQDQDQDQANQQPVDQAPDGGPVDTAVAPAEPQEAEQAPLGQAGVAAGADQAHAQ